MKNKLLTLVLIFVSYFPFSFQCFSQTGNIDTSQILLSSPIYDYKNPQFDKTGSSINYFIKDCILAYEKWSSPLNSKIAVRFMKYDSLKPEVELTDDLFLNINPAVAYLIEQSTPSENNPGAVVFQTNRNGNWDIYFSYYNSNSWSSPVAIANDTDDETNPVIVPYTFGNVKNFLVAYEKNNDVYIKNYYNNAWEDEVNITSNDSLNCFSPSLTKTALGFNPMFIAYERNRNGINSISYHRLEPTSSGINVWAMIEINQPAPQTNIRFSNGVNDCILNYDYGTIGNRSFYSAFIFISTFLGNQTSNFTGDNFGGTGSSHGDITSDLLGGYSFYSWIRKIEDSTQIVIGAPISMFYVGDSSTETFVNSSTKLVHGSLYRIRFLWEQSVNGKTALVESFRDGGLTSLKQNTSSIPETFSLEQNYPNPFNPKTIINYSIPSNVKGQMSNVKLVVYNNLGKETITLVNENKNPGNYETEFDGSDFSSGIYFYRLEAGDFSETKRMILIK